MQCLSTPLEAGELEFLAERVMNVIVSDAELRFSVRLDQNKLCAGAEASDADLTIEGTVYTFLVVGHAKGRCGYPVFPPSVEDVGRYRTRTVCQKLS